jgi:uncharacterized protein
LTRSVSPILRDAGPDDFGAICALNAAEVQHTSVMDLIQLTELDALSNYHKVACHDGVVAAFLLAMTDGSAYRNDNYEWFSQRYPKFLYVDRIVVSAASRGLRLGSLLYEDLFNYARAQGIPRVACEYNIVPPNEPSRLFHDKFGFEQQGTQWLGNGTKQVSLQIAKT